MPLTLTVSESGGFDLHEADEWYDGTITGYEETEGQWGAGLKFLIVLDGEEDADDGYPRETWAFTSQKLSPRSKLYSWAKGLGWDPADEEFTPADYVDTRVQCMFEHYLGTDPDGNSIEKEKVVKLRKGKGKAKKAAKAKKPADDPEAPF